MKNKILIPIVVFIFALVVGFFGGLTYQKSQTTTRFAQMGNRQTNGLSVQNGTGQKNGTMMRGNAPVSGKIINQDTTSITVQSADGSNKIIIISDQTKVNKTQVASKTDLKVGDEVMVIGTTDTNGSVTAQSISLGSLLPTPSVLLNK
jgi:hypothetical protein